MRKIIALLLVAILAFSLAACSMMKDKTNTTKPSTSSNNSTNTNGTNKTEAPTQVPNENTKTTENLLESMIPDVSTNVSTEGQR